MKSFMRKIFVNHMYILQIDGHWAFSVLLHCSMVLLHYLKPVIRLLSNPTSLAHSLSMFHHPRFGKRT